MYEDKNGGSSIVFPTPVGVFLVQHLQRPFLFQSSPHPWGCFSCLQEVMFFPVVFPTPVGVFLCKLPHLHTVDSLPHTRGGVSTSFKHAIRTYKSSPHPWGCFCHCLIQKTCLKVFPTPVGVFPRFGLQSPCLGRLPHTRGGVSIDDLVDFMME